jgi:hypothetical protein
MLAAQNQGNPQFNSSTSGLLPQSMLQQQQQHHQLPSQHHPSNAMMMQMMMAAQQQQQQPQYQPHSQLGSDSLQQSSANGMSLMNSRFGDQQRQQAVMASLLGNNPSSFLDTSNRGQDMLSMSQQPQQQQPSMSNNVGGGGGNSGFGDLQSNLRQLEMANDLLQRRLSMGFGGGGGGINAGGNFGIGGGGGGGGFPNQLDINTGQGAMGGGMDRFGTSGGGDGPGKNPQAMLDQLQGLDTSNLGGIMASQSQLQQQQQQLTQMQQLMMATGQQQQQQDQHRRASFVSGGPGGMDAALAMQLQSMMNQQYPGTGRMDVPVSQQLQQRLQHFNPSGQVSADEMGAMGGTGGTAMYGDGKGFPKMSMDETTVKKPRKKKAKTFPEKLMQAMAQFGEEEAVAWLPDGKSFVIVNDDLFVEQVLNAVFKESKYTR